MLIAGQKKKKEKEKNPNSALLFLNSPLAKSLTTIL